MAVKRQSQGFVSEATNTLQCAYRDGDNRGCRFPGSCSTNTLGGGPWFCFDHFREQNNAFADEVVSISREVGPLSYDAVEVRKVFIANHAARFPVQREPGEDHPRGRDEVLAELRRFRERITSQAKI